MTYSANSNFWELGDYKTAHLSKLQLPSEELEKISNWWKKPRNMLVFLGNPGSGKSYLIAAMIHELLERKVPFRYLHERDLNSIVRETITRDWEHIVEIKRICETPFIFLDDIHSGNMTPFQKESLFNFIDQRILSEYPTVITSNLFFNQMDKVFEGRVISRLKSKKNTIIELNWIDKRQQEVET